MSKQKLPYVLGATMAMRIGDREGFNRIVALCMQDVSTELISLIQEYDPADLPFVIASIIVCANGMRSVLGEDGNGIVDYIINHTELTAVNADELMKQVKEEQDEGK